MLVLLVALVAGLVVGYALGGRLRNLESLDLRHAWLALAALALQLVIFSPLTERLGDAVVPLHLVSYGMLLWFVVANRHRGGIVVAGVGTALNVAAIAANGGYMPASRSALERAGALYAGETANNSALMGEGTRLWFLGDVFAVPEWFVLANVFSVGDVLIAAGVAVLVAAGMRGHARQVPELA